MAVVTKTRSFTFRCVHELNSGPRREVRHGHEYKLEVTWRAADVDTDSDVDVVAASVSDAVLGLVLNKLDRHDLTGLIEPATGEVIVEWIHTQLRDTPGIVAIAIQETLKNRFISSGSDLRYVG
jgi:6-pyruvoyl-tetrahydropterin synthase